MCLVILVHPVPISGAGMASGNVAVSSLLALTVSSLVVGVGSVLVLLLLLLSVVDRDGVVTAVLPAAPTVVHGDFQGRPLGMVRLLLLLVLFSVVDCAAADGVVIAVLIAAPTAAVEDLLGRPLGMATRL